MTQYSNPALTQREIVEQSVEAIDAMVDAINILTTETNDHRDAMALDYMTNQIISQQVSSLLGSKIQLDAERLRLTTIIADWDAAA
ncbi:hypothetical protein ASE85_03235 [Sphingobium sp. Leaf26]|uniref:hypothetical protein n=1 Tax=Sphingobium sp. Leaf26 TaxID=1735693 RepID=UPI0006F64BFB|nr:hypothetical protein [Sphingobium sp. Leaf26]KQN09957.1 hypothetical protein ASE85_03235 [Sphingobium sp. Leaf26]